jgi:hypothetical protein
VSKRQLLIDHVVLCWLCLQDAETSYPSAMERSLTFTQADYWDR